MISELDDPSRAIRHGYGRELKSTLHQNPERADLFLESGWQFLRIDLQLQTRIPARIRKRNMVGQCVLDHSRGAYSYGHTHITQ